MTFRRWGHYCLGEIQRKPILLFIILVWCVNASFNWRMGKETADLAFAWALVGLACLGAWAATEQARARGLRRTGLVIVVMLQIVLGLWAGWQALGLTLSRGDAALSATATSRETLENSLQRMRAERATIAADEPIAALEAQAKLECSITSRRFPDGEGPKCTALKTRLEAQRRAAYLDQAIPQAVARLQAKGESASIVDDRYAVPRALAERIGAIVYGDVSVGNDDVRFAWNVFLVVFLEFVATLGFWFAGVGGSNARPREAAAGPYGGGSGGGYFHGDDDWDDDAADAWPSRRAAAHGEQQIRDGVPVDFAPAGASRSRRLRDERPARAALGFEGHSPSSAHAHGAPISIYLGQPAASGPAAAAQADAPAEAEPDGRPDARQRRSDNTNMRAAHAAPDAPPVDRSRVADDIGEDEREAADVIASFAAACLEPTSGGIVSARDVYRRYCAWARDRAVEEEAFVDLLGRTTGWAARPIGGIQHVRGVALRMGEPMLEVVA